MPTVGKLAKPVRSRTDISAGPMAKKPCGDKLRGVLWHIKRADRDFGLIQDGDKIAVGLSGGKDSLTLLSALCEYRNYGKQFEIVAITVDCTDGKTDFSRIIKFCEELGVCYRIEPSKILEIVFDIRKEKNPCSLCSKLRRGVLNSAAKRLGCNKVALAHHGDDLIETFFLSLAYEGRLSSFAPKSYLDRMDLTLIRPLVYATEKEIIRASGDFPVLANSCPVNHRTKREYMKELTVKLDTDIPGARGRVLDAITKKERFNLFR
jgi:tRNA(Ile)-lysidine synthase TilS/MesJ